MFANRITVTNLAGQIVQSNGAATVEAGEPRHGGKPGGHSLWISWVAVTNGIVTFKTEASGFDTLLSAYQFTSTNVSFVGLREVARSDDAEGLEFESEIRFGVKAGQQYEIAVDGYRGAVGEIDFQWETRPLAAAPPLIVSSLADRAVKLGDTLSLAFTVTNAAAGAYKWEMNGREIDNAFATNLVVTNVSATDVGFYRLRVVVGGGVSYYSVPVEIQINTEGASNTLARPKILDTPDSPLIGDDGSAKSFGGLTKRIQPMISMSSLIGVVRGYNGSQVFNTTFATTDPAEPAHCGNPPGASYWLMYQPPANGTMTFDTIGSSYDTVMEVYTFNGALTSYTNLISLACNNDLGAARGPSRVSVQAVKSRQYVVVVDGVAGARGSAWLNYNLNTNQPALPPTTPSLVATQTIFVGANLTLAPAISGAPVLVHRWKKNGANIPNVTVPVLTLQNVTSAGAATYTLTTTNDLGAVNVTNIVHVVTPMNCTVAKSAGTVNFAFPTAADLRYTILCATNAAGPWTQWAAPFTGDGGDFSTNIAPPGANFFRVRIE
ncbi:MAG: hypothetical protein HYR88_04245 [Verrucomicrobia bacterium]|nr:hypothetical protein [Verrucomicrobiota bacterium]